MMERRVVEIIAQATLVPVERLLPEARPEDLGIDSMGLVEAIFALEEGFDIRIPFDAHQGARGIDTATIGSIVAGVLALVEERQPA